MSATASYLLRGIRAQVANDSSPRVRALVDYVIAERPAVRQLDRVLHALRSTSVPSWFGALNGARCYTRMRAVGSPGGVFACVRRDNERSAAAWLRGQVPDLPWTEVEFDFDSVRSTLRDTPPGIGARLRRSARFASALRDRHELFHVLRVMELLSYHERLGELLDAGDYRVAVMSTYSNPWGIALNMAAAERGIPVVHIMHGTALDPVPRLDYAAVIFNDASSPAVFARAGCRVGEAIVRGGSVGLMRAALPANGITVGVLLSKEPSQANVTDLVRRLAARPEVEEIIVRPHPANLWTRVRVDLPAISPRISVSGAPAAYDYARCDVVVAGQSSVHLDALAAGVPSVYSDALDERPGAIRIAFLEDGTVYRSSAPLPDLSGVARHYAAVDWPTRFGRHVNTGASAVETRDRVRMLLHRLATGSAS